MRQVTPKGLAVWYDMPPADYAESLRYGAARSDESAARQRAEGKPWSEHEARHMERQARRLRAMALLCDRSPADRAGAVDMRRLSDPTLDRETEAATVAEILAALSRHRL